MKASIFTILFSLLSTTAMAAIDANIGVVSDYVWRGQTQTSHNPAIQGGMDYSHKSGLAVGTWISNTSSETEADFYASYSYSFTDKVSATLGYTYYHYLVDHGSDAHEANLTVSAWGFDLMTAYTDDYFASESSAMYYSLSRSFDVLPNDGIALGLTVGYSMFDDEDKVGQEDYLDYTVSLTKTVKNSEISINYTDTDCDDIDHTFYVAYTTSF